MSDGNNSGYRQSKLVANLGIHYPGELGDDGGGNQDSDSGASNTVGTLSSSSAQPKVDGNRGKSTTRDDGARDTQASPGNSGTARSGNFSNASGRSGRRNKRTSSRGSSGKTSRSTANADGQKFTQENVPVGDRPPNVVNFDDAKSAKDWAVKLEDLASILSTGSMVVAQFAGQHWQFLDNESRSLAKAIKELPASKNSWLMKFLSKNQPYINFVMVLGSIVGTRAFISYQLARNRYDNISKSQQATHQTERAVYTDEQASSGESQESVHGSDRPSGEWYPNPNANWHQKFNTATG